MKFGFSERAARRPLAAIAVLAIAAAGMAPAWASDASATAKSPWNVRDHIPLSEITVQSHRGAGELAPENTLEAFELAWKLGTVPEADLRVTRDGVIVAFHDSNFKRLIKGASPELQAKGIPDLDWAEVQRLDVGAWKDEKFAGCRVPSIDQILGLLAGKPQRRLYLDIKDIDLDRLAGLVREAGVESQVILASTDYELICRWKELAPAAGTLHWMGGTEAELAERLQKLQEAGFAGVTQLQIHVRTQETASGKVLSPSEPFLVETGRRLREHGILFQALPWGRSDPPVYWQLMDLGVASFATDYPEVTMKAIRDYYGKKD
ncbi:MAG: glycerophosphodiester phosphodiesterase [Thermoguttaceae bacterium]